MPDLAISCVVDDAPRFRREALNWIASLHSTGCLAVMQPFVHHVGKPPQAFVGKMRELGVELVPIAAFGEGPAAYCNKLRQFDTFAASSYGSVLLSDTDIVFLKSPARLTGRAAVRAKIVDMANPSEMLLSRLLTRAGFSEEPISGNPDFAHDRHTHRLNCNGGLYVLERDALRKINEPWKRWSRFCLSQVNILRKKIVHSDQLGFMLSMIELGLPFDGLPAHDNFPTHLPVQAYSGIETSEITALHYHRRTIEHGTWLLPTGNEAVDVFIRRANEIIARSRAELGIDFDRHSS